LGAEQEAYSAMPPPRPAAGPAAAIERVRSSLPRHAFIILFGVQVVVAVGNTGMQSVLPAIGRSIGIPDFMVAAIFSLSALCWAASSPWWARVSDRRGRKPLILLGLAGFAVSMTLCGLVVSAGLHGWTTPIVTFVLFLLARAIFGFFGAAANPATQAYIAERTTRRERTQALATIAGAFGMGTLGGPVLAPMFVHVPWVGLAGPMFAFALIAAAMLIVVLKLLVEPPVPSSQPKAKSRKDVASPEMAGRPAKRSIDLSMFRDPRLTPFLVYGFLVSTCQSAQAQTLGFLVIDKQNLPPLEAQTYIMIAMMGGAVAGLLAQWGMIRTFSMTPRGLLRWGVGLAAAGNLVTALAPGYGAVVVGYAISNLGYGFARPGFTAGASLSVDMANQARAAGAIAAVNGINVVFAPLFVLLYEAFAPAPFLLNMTIMAVVLVYCFKSAALSTVNDESAPEGVVTTATLERRDEGGV